METIITNYTHSNVYISDIRLKKGRKNNDDFFAIKIQDVDDILFVNYNIFNDRIKAFFLGKSVDQIKRQHLLDLKWNFIITDGYYLKIIEKDYFDKIPGVSGKKYVSVLEISGPIGDFANNFSNEVRVYDTTKEILR